MFNKKVSIFPGNYKANLQNAIFDKKKINPWMDWVGIFIPLKKYLNKRKIDICTYDKLTEESSYRYVYFDLPYPWDLSNFNAWKLILTNRDKNILICHEPPIIIPFNYMKMFHFFFSKIYTWDDKIVDNRKYFIFYRPQYKLSWNISYQKFKSKKKFGNKKFLVLINSNKSPFFPFKILSPFGKELYSKRIKAIEFFEQNIPDNFFLYGKGWNKPKKYNLTEKLFGFKKYFTYKGEIKNKIEKLADFKYSICFENLTDVDGYLTEKIFDCFKARCVPIYWGASNIEKYIPKNCFIDFRDFDLNYEKLLNFLVSIDEKKYGKYIKNIEKLLINKKFVNQWFEVGFINFFYNEILDLKRYD